MRVSLRMALLTTWMRNVLAEEESKLSLATVPDGIFVPFPSNPIKYVHDGEGASITNGSFKSRQATELYLSKAEIPIDLNRPEPESFLTIFVSSACHKSDAVNLGET